MALLPEDSLCSSSALHLSLSVVCLNSHAMAKVGRRGGSVSSAAASLLGAGAGGVEELCEQLRDDVVAWALLRWEVGSGTFVRSKLVAIHFNGEEVPAVRRGRLNARSGEVMALLGEAHATLEVKRKEDLHLNFICERLMKVLTADAMEKSMSAEALRKDYENLIAEQKMKKASSQKSIGPRTAKETQKNITVDWALSAVGDATGPYNWALLEPEKLELHNAGYGGIVEMKDWLNEDMVLFGMVRFTFGREKAASTMEGMTAAPKVVKYVFIHWVGPKVSAVRRGKWNAKQKQADAQVRSICNITFRREAHSLDDLDLGDLISELLRLAVVDGAVSDAGKSQISVEEYMASLALEKQQIEADLEDEEAGPEPIGDLDTCVASVREAGGDMNWVLLGMKKPETEVKAAAEAKKAEADTLAKEAAAAEAKKAEADKLAKEAAAAEAKKAEADRLAKEAAAAEAKKAEADKLAKEAAVAEAKKAETDKLAKEAAAAEAKKAEADRLAKEAAAAEAKKAEADKLAKEAAAPEAKKAEADRLAKEAAAAEAKKAEADKLAKEAAVAEAKKAEADRLAKEANAAEAKKAEADKLAKEAAAAEAKKAEADKLAKEAAAAEAKKAEADRLAKEAAAAEAKKAEADKLAKEAAAAEAKKAEADKLAKEAAAAEAKKAEADKLAKEAAAAEAKKAEADRLAKEAVTAAEPLSGGNGEERMATEGGAPDVQAARTSEVGSSGSCRPGQTPEQPRMSGQLKLKSGWGWWWAQRHVELKRGKLQWWRKGAEGPPDVEAMGERVLLRAKTEAEAQEWKQALMEQMEYVEGLLAWPMPLDGRQGDIRFYGIEYP
eukprot:s42_g31.t2